MRAADEDAYRILYDDIEGDQQFWNIFAALILAGATFGAFNLASRMVEAQRREIGIGMALGWSPAAARRAPAARRRPDRRARRRPRGRRRAAGRWPPSARVHRRCCRCRCGTPLPAGDVRPRRRPRVRAAVRSRPPGRCGAPCGSCRSTPSPPPIARRAAACPRCCAGCRWPRSAFRRMPLGNVLRTPRRTVLTALGIGAAVATLVVILGMLDSFHDTMDRNDRELLGDHPDRRRRLPRRVLRPRTGRRSPPSPTSRRVGDVRAGAPRRRPARRDGPRRDRGARRRHTARRDRLGIPPSTRGDSA